MLRIVITGGSSGLGAILVRRFEEEGHKVFNWSLDTGVDVTDESSVDLATLNLPTYVQGIDTLINCAGINRIGYIPDTNEETWDKVLDTNAKGIFLTAKYLAESLRGGTILNIVSNAAHIPMTGSIAYNASKGAALIMTKQMARELGKTHGITVFSISPNKLAGTGMSRDIEEQVCRLRGWTPEEAKAYQLAALPAGEETDPEVLGEFIVFLLSKKERHKYLVGCDLQYGGP